MLPLMVCEYIGVCQEKAADHDQAGSSVERFVEAREGMFHNCADIKKYHQAQGTQEVRS